MKTVPLSPRLALAVFLVLRRRKLEPTLLVGGAIAAVVLLASTARASSICPTSSSCCQDVGERLGTWTYLLVGVLAFLETGAFIGLIAPGESAIILGGVVAGQGQIEVVMLMAIVWAPRSRAT